MSPASETGPTTSSGTVYFVSRIANLVPPAHFMIESSSRDFAHPGGPIKSTCSLAMSEVRTRSISSSRSMSVVAISVRAATNLE